MDDAERWARFSAKFVVAPSGCWLWTAAKSSSGYGVFKADRLVQAHRYAYGHLVGPIPDGLQLDHLCRVRACVNPSHMEPVTCRVNLLRGDTIQARNAAKTRCKHGHEFTAENTRIDGRGCRRCRACQRQFDVNRVRVRRSA